MTIDICKYSFGSAVLGAVIVVVYEIITHKALQCACMHGLSHAQRVHAQTFTHTYTHELLHTYIQTHTHKRIHHIYYHLFLPANKNATDAHNSINTFSCMYV